LKTIYVAIIKAERQNATINEDIVNVFNLLSTIEVGFLKRRKQV